MTFFAAIARVCCLALLLAGCTSTTAATRTTLSAAVALAAEVPNMPRVRHWGDRLPPDLGQLVAERDAQLKAFRPQLLLNRKAPLNFLALSGGGGDGAFGAGVLNGWTSAGTRPEFEVVTGISAGALMAPLAFLGQSRDAGLRELYTAYGTKDLVNFKVLTGIFGGSAITGDNELKALIAKFATDDLLAQVAAEHARGRRLYVGTTNLDAQRPVVWDMGAIAASNAPNKAQLFRDVLLASASVPGLFPPVLIDAVSGSQKLEEVHVDGGATAEVFFLPPQILSAALREKQKGRAPIRLYVISNGKLSPEWAAVQPSTFPIVTRSIDTLIKSQWRSDLSALYATAQTSGIDFNLLGVPDSFALKPKETFDKAYMTALFDVGRQMGAGAPPWLKSPPR
jgi:Patatin-like phospholipase